MCGLCGIMGSGPHWTDAPANADLPQRRRRLVLIAKANHLLAPLGLALSDFHGTQFVLANSKGATRMVDSLATLWLGVDDLGGKYADPLDPAYLRHLVASRNPR